jgi:hypothetical protein
MLVYTSNPFEVFWPIEKSRRDGNLHDIEATTSSICCRLKRFDRSLTTRIMSISYVISPSKKNLARLRETADIIDVTICVIVCGQTLRQPDHFLASK